MKSEKLSLRSLTPHNIVLRITSQSWRSSRDNSCSKEISRYPQVVKDAADKLEPFVVSRYAVALAQAFNKFYHDCQINVEEENIKYTRANIVIIVKSILKDALSLLGIQCPEQM